MIAYLMKAQYITVLISSYNLTTLHFEVPVNCTFSRGVDSSGRKVLDVVYERAGRSVSLIPKAKFNTSFNCYTSDDKVYFFNAVFSKDKWHKNIIVKDAKPVSGGKLVYKKNDIEVYENSKSYYVKNSSKRPVNVNDLPVNKSKVVSKWLPLDLNGRLVWF